MTIAESLAQAFDQTFLKDQQIVSTIYGIARLVESKDTETGNHIERMQSYTVLMARLLQNTEAFENRITDTFIRDPGDFSPLHDIWKVAIPDEIPLKPGRLTDEEFIVMKTYAVTGSDILKEMDKGIRGGNHQYHQMGINIAQNLHEKFDGSGYPNGLVGKSIPLEARIVAIADIFDALASRRSYKEAYSLEKARRIITEGRDTYFDPDSIDILLDEWTAIEQMADSLWSGDGTGSAWKYAG